MNKLIAFIAMSIFFIPNETNANDNFSVEIEALTLVMEQYEENNDSRIKIDIDNKKPSFMALKKDECNAIVEVKTNDLDNYNYIDEKFHFQTTRFSKYCNAIEELNIFF